MITPTKTAKARLWRITVIAATKIPTMTSDFGILVKSLKNPHWKVEMATIIITPTKAAIGICSITFPPTRMTNKIPNAPTMAEILVLAPALMFTKV